VPSCGWGFLILLGTNRAQFEESENIANRNCLKNKRPNVTIRHHAPRTGGIAISEISRVKNRKWVKSKNVKFCMEISFFGLCPKCRTWPLRKFVGSCFLKSIRFRVDPFPFSRVVFPVKRMCFQSTCVNRSRVAGCRRLRITVRARRPLRKLCPGPVDREKNEVPGARRPRKK
jgi:hypothetical protein